MNSKDIEELIEDINQGSEGFKFSLLSWKHIKNGVKLVLDVSPNQYGALSIEQLMGDPEGSTVEEAFGAFDAKHDLTEEEAQSIADTLNAYAPNNPFLKEELEATVSIIEQASIFTHFDDFKVNTVFEIGQHDLWDTDEVFQRWEDRTQ